MGTRAIEKKNLCMGLSSGDRRLRRGILLPKSRLKMPPRRLLLEVNPDADKRPLLGDLVVQAVHRMVHGEITVADIGGEGLVDVVTEAAIELAGHVAIRAAADVAIEVGE